jgi:hypothetical protein
MQTRTIIPFPLLWKDAKIFSDFSLIWKSWYWSQGIFFPFQWLLTNLEILLFFLLIYHTYSSQFDHHPIVLCLSLPFHIHFTMALRKKIMNLLSSQVKASWELIFGWDLGVLFQSQKGGKWQSSDHSQSHESQEIQLPRDDSSIIF